MDSTVHMHVFKQHVITRGWLIYWSIDLSIRKLIDKRIELCPERRLHDIHSVIHSSIDHNKITNPTSMPVRHVRYWSMADNSRFSNEEYRLGWAPYLPSFALKDFVVDIVFADREEGVDAYNDDDEPFVVEKMLRVLSWLLLLLLWTCAFVW